MGPDIKYTPHSRLPTQDTVPGSESKYLNTGSQTSLQLGASQVSLAEWSEEDAEAVGDAVQDHVAEEAGGAHHPAPAAVRRRWSHEILLTQLIISMTL